MRIGKEDIHGAGKNNMSDLRETVSKEDVTAKILLAGVRAVCQSSQQSETFGKSGCGGDSDIYVPTLRRFGKSHGSHGQASQILLAIL